MEVEADPTGEIPAVTAENIETRTPESEVDGKPPNEASEPALDPVPASPELLAAAAAAAPSADLLSGAPPPGFDPDSNGALHLRYWDSTPRQTPLPPPSPELEGDADPEGKLSHYFDLSQRRWPKLPDIADEEDAQIKQGGYWDKKTIRR